MNTMELEQIKGFLVFGSFSSFANFMGERVRNPLLFIPISDH